VPFARHNRTRPDPTHPTQKDNLNRFASGASGLPLSIHYTRARMNGVIGTPDSPDANPAAAFGSKAAHSASEVIYTPALWRSTSLAALGPWYAPAGNLLVYLMWWLL